MKIIMIKHNKTSAFTLAEVLITLGIIGIVAAMTIPTLMNKTQEAELKSALKKNITNISQASLQMAQDNGGDLKGFFQGDSRATIDKIANYIKYVKICHFNVDTNGCWHNGTDWKDYDGNPAAPEANGYISQFNSTASGLITPDGAFILTSWASSPDNCNTAWFSWEDSGRVTNYNACNVVFVDVNGFKKPNKAGHDIFALSMRSNGSVYPGFPSPPTWDVRTKGIDCASKILNNQSCQ